MSEQTIDTVAELMRLNGIAIMGEKTILFRWKGGLWVTRNRISAEPSVVYYSGTSESDAVRAFVENEAK